MVELDRVFHALAGGTRRAILDRLAGGESTVGEVARPFDLTLAAVSKHIRVLEDAGLVRRSWQGRTAWLRLDAGGLEAADTWLERHRRDWNARLDSLERYLRRKRTDRND